MKLRTIAAVAPLVVSTLGLAAGTSYAAPATAQEVHYSAERVGDSIVTTTDIGKFSLTADGHSFVFSDQNGHALLQMPLTYTLNGLQYPMDQAISTNGKTLTLTPVRDVSRAVPNLGSLMHPAASNDENLKAYGKFLAALGLASAVGGLVGLIVGAALGCLLLVPLLGIGCVAGLAAGGAAGATIGAVLAGGPTAIAAGIDLVNTLQAAPGKSKYANPPA